MSPELANLFKQRAVLAMLVLQSNQVVAIDHLIDGLWGQTPPDGATNVIQVYISRLRKTLHAAFAEGSSGWSRGQADRREGQAAAVLVRRTPGYLLHLDADELDLDRFQRLTDQGAQALRGAPELAAVRLRQALSLWRGPPLAEFTDEPFAQAQIVWLEERRLAALQARIEADLALGRHAELVAELQALVAEYPLQEGLHQQLLLSLYRSGRQAEALAAYQRTRTLLAEELGIDPGRALQELQSAILAQDARLDWTPPPSQPTPTPAEPTPTPGKPTPAVADSTLTGPAPAAPTAPVFAPVPLAAAAGPPPETWNGTGEPDRPFVGRAWEMRELRAALAEAAAGQGRLLLVTGEPGIGKSRLMEEFARLVVDQGWRVLVGRCWEHGGAPAYWPWIQVIRAAGGEFEDYLPGSRNADDRSSTSEPEWAPAPVNPESDRFRLFDGVARFLAGVAGKDPVLVVLDDLHAADEPTLLLLRFVVQTMTAERILLLGAYREAEGRVHELAELFADLARVGHRIPLRGLSRPEVGAYMGQVAGRAPPEAAVARVHDVTAGNPFFVGEVTRVLPASGSLDDPGDSVADPLGRIPEEVRALIRRRVAGLSTEAVSNLRVGAVIGREFELHILRRISRLSLGRLAEALSEAVRAGILVEDVAVPGRYAFSHDLVRETLYQDMAIARRLALHRTIGLVLAQVFHEDLEPHLAVLAHHFVQSAALGDAAPAVEYSTRAGDHAAALLAYEDAARHYARALDLLSMLEDAGGARRCALLLRLGDAQWRAGDTEKARRSFEEVAAVSDRLDAPETLARAALGYVTAGAPVRLGLGGLILTGNLGEGMTGIRRLEQALAALPEGDSSLRTQVLARLATELYPTGQTDRQAALSEQAVAMAQRLGDSEALLVALHSRHWAAMAPDHINQRLTNAAEMLDVAAKVGDEEMAFLARHARLHDFLELCDVGRVDAELEAMALTADRIRQPFYQWHMTSMRAMRAMLDGRLEEAERLARSTLEITGLRPGEYVTYVFEHALMVAIRWQQGRLGELQQTVRAHGEQYPSIARWRNALAAVELADERTARDEIERHARSDFAELPRNGLWILHLCALAEACVLIRDQQRAARLYELLSPFAERNVVPLSTMPFGPVALRLGMLAAMLGRWQEAERHFEVAMERCGRLGARAVTARVLYERSRMLLAQGAGGDHATAAELLAQAEAICRELDLPGISKRIAALAASVAQPRRPEGAHAAAGAVFRREGDYWTLAYRGELARLRDTKGLGYLACLLRHPGREVHVLELVREVEGSPNKPAQGPRRADAVAAGLGVSRLEEADPLLDAQAKEAYRRRLRELEEDLEEARSWSDPERAARAEAEIDALTTELARAAGLGGRHRPLATPAERARVSVTKATRTAIRTVGRHCPALGDHLAASVRTGRFCSYAPPGETPPAWSL
jgi:DNA-binding SARP family transcriptional activator